MAKASADGSPPA